VLLPYALISPPHKGSRPGGGKQPPTIGPLAARRRGRYMDRMKMAAIILPLLAFLAASVWFAYYVWASDAGPPLPASGYVAMALGVLFSLVVGIGLMALVFYSHRHGYDDSQGGNQD
jgi:formate hydrogenlyase subunit 3/multisubunit Na+/H+ antiporter MnhD subunit